MSNTLIRTSKNMQEQTELQIQDTSLHGTNLCNMKNKKKMQVLGRHTEEHKVTTLTPIHTHHVPPPQQNSKNTGTETKENNQQKHMKNKFWSVQLRTHEKPSGQQHQMHHTKHRAP